MKHSDLTPKDYSPLNIEAFVTLHRDVIDTAVQEARRHFENLYDSIMRTRQYSTMILTLLSAVLAALIGSIFANPQTPLMIPLVMGVIANIIPICIFIRGLFYRRKIQWSGASPDYYLSEKNLEWVRQMKEWNPDIYDEYKYFQLLYLDGLHYNIYLDREIQKDLTLWYRRGLHCTVATYSVWIAASLLSAIICA